MSVVAPTPDAGPRPIQAHEQKAAVRVAAGVETAKLGNGMTPEQAKQVQRVGEKIAHKKGHEALEALAGNRERFKHAATWEATVDYLAPADADAIKKRTKLYLELAEKGFDGLTDDRRTGDSKADKQDVLRGEIHAFLLSNPTLRDALTETTFRGTQEIPHDQLENMLRNPALHAALIQTLNELYDPDPSKLPNDEALTKAKNEVVEAKNNVDHFKQLKKGAEEKLKAFQDKDHAFKNKMDYNATSLGLKGITKQEAYDKLRIHPNVTKIQMLEQRVAQLRLSGLDSKSKALQAVEQDLTDAMSVGATQYAEFMSLTAEQNAFTRGIEEEAATIRSADLELKSHEGKKKTAEAEVKRLQLGRDGVTAEFTSKIMDALGETAREQIAAKAEEIIREYPEFATNLDKETQEAAHKKIQDFLEKRYLKQERRGWLLQKQFVLNKRLADQDLQNMLKGFDDAVKKGKTPFEVQKDWVESALHLAGISADEQKVLLADEGFVKGQFTDLLKKAYTTHTTAEMGIIETARADRQISDYLLERRLSNFFDAHPIGQEVAVGIIGSNSEAKAAVEKATGGAPLSTESIQKLRKNKKGLTILAILLALGIKIVPFEDLTKGTNAHAAAA